MTVKEGIQAGTRVTLSLRDYLAQAGVIITVVGSVVWWGSVKLADQQKADQVQNERIGSIENSLKRAEADNANTVAALSKLADRLENVNNKLVDIGVGVARIDERTRGK